MGGGVLSPFSCFVLFSVFVVSFSFLFIFFSVLNHFKLSRHFIKMCLSHHIYLCKNMAPPEHFCFKF